MAKKIKSAEAERDEVLDIIMSAIGLVLASKRGGKTNPVRDHECAVNVLGALEDDGFKVVRDAQRS